MRASGAAKAPPAMILAANPALAKARVPGIASTKAKGKKRSRDSKSLKLNHGEYSLSIQSCCTCKQQHCSQDRFAARILLRNRMRTGQNKLQGAEIYMQQGQLIGIQDLLLLAWNLVHALVYAVSILCEFAMGVMNSL